MGAVCGQCITNAPLPIPFSTTLLETLPALSPWPEWFWKYNDHMLPMWRVWGKRTETTEAPASSGLLCWDLQLVMSVNRQFLTFTVQVEMTSHPRLIHKGGIAGARLLGSFQAHEIPKTLTGIFPWSENMRYIWTPRVWLTWEKDKVTHTWEKM